MKTKQKIIFLAIAFISGAITASTQYVSAYFKTIGMSSMQIGLFTTLRSLVGVVCPFVWGILCDKYKTVRKIYIVCLIGAVIFYPLIPISNKIFYFDFLMIAPWISVIARFFYRPLEEIYYSWVIQKDYPFNKIKISSAIGNVSIAIIVAAIIKKTTIENSFYVFGILGCINLILAFNCEDVNYVDNKKISFKDLHIQELFTNKTILAYLLFSFFVSIPAASASNFTVYYLEVRGIAINDIGLFQAIKALCRVPLLFFVQKFVKKENLLKLMIICCSISTFSEIIYALTSTQEIYYAFVAIQNLAIGLQLFVRAKYISSISPKRIKNTMQLTASVTGACTTMFSSILGGFLIDSYGIRTLNIVGASISVLSIICFSIFSLKNKTENVQEG